MRTAARPRATRSKTLWSDFRTRAVEPVAERERGSGWPLTGWQGDPVGFAREVLGAFVMPHQARILENVRDDRNTAVRAGQKTGKTNVLVLIALWAYCCFPHVRVVLTANTKEQVRNVLWSALRGALRDSKTRIDGKWSDNPATGFRAADGREIFGQTTREVEAAGGISGGAIFVLVDEASALEQAKADALEGNRAGAGYMRMAYFFNPTRAEGPAFEAFYSRQAAWRLHHLDSEVIAPWHHSAAAEIREWQRSRGFTETGYLPGLVVDDTIRKWKEDYGEGSPFYQVRVKGNFLLHEGGKAITLHTIKVAQDAWADAEEDGELSIGVDVAGPGEGGDADAFAIVRGQKVVGLFAFHGLSEDSKVQHLLSFLKVHRRPDDHPIVNIDAEGPHGSAFYGRMRAVAASVARKPGKSFEVNAVRASKPIKGYEPIYERVRDALIANLDRWLKDGGAIPADHKLAEELHAADWIGRQGKGTLRLTDKSDIKVKIGRSPDLRDALALAVWREVNFAALVAAQVTAVREAPQDAQDAAFLYDQQSGNDIWWPAGV